MSEAQEPSRLVSSGWALYLAGNMRGAQRDFRAALAISPDDVQALVGLVQTQIALNQLADADEAAARLLKIAPTLAQAHRVQGEVLRRRRRLGGAICDAARVSSQSAVGAAAAAEPNPSAPLPPGSLQSDLIPRVALPPLERCSPSGTPCPWPGLAAAASFGMTILMRGCCC